MVLDISDIEFYYYIIAAGVAFGGFPFLGRLVYIMKNKLGRLLSVYFLSIAGFFALNVVLSADTINFRYTVEIISQLRGIKLTYILSLILYFLGGFGLFGSIAEKSVEALEEIDLLSTLERRRSVIKQYFMYLLYGYVFVFSVYSVSKILLIAMGMPNPIIQLEKIYTTLGFESVLLVLVGASLFFLKSFHYGLFSREYWKSLSAEESEDTTWRTLRKLFIIFIFVWAIYISFIVFFVQIFTLDTSLFTADPLLYVDTVPIIHSLQFIFYITTTFQTLYFFTHMFKLVSSLKSVDPNFKKKVDDSIIVEDDSDEDIKF